MLLSFSSPTQLRCSDGDMNVRAVDSRGSGDIQRLTTGDSEVVAARCLVVVIRIASKLIGCAVIPPKMGTATSKKRGLSADKSGPKPHTSTLTVSYELTIDVRLTSLLHFR